MELIAFKTIQIIARAMNDSELDCSDWAQSVTEELAVEILTALYVAGYQVVEKDK